jgi:uncharacterized protein YjiS (DUF1127 family)
LNTMTVQRPHQGSSGFQRMLEAFACIRLQWRVARDIRHLEKMTDHDLRDIGIRRDEIRSAVFLGRTMTAEAHSHSSSFKE